MQKLLFDLPGVAGSLTTKLWMLQRTYNWQFLLPEDIGGISGIWVSQYCQDVRFGDYSISDVPFMQYGSKQRFYAGKETIEPIGVSFIMPVDNSPYEYFKEWRKLVIDDKGFYHPKNVYKKDAHLVFFDRTGIQSVSFVFKGCFPLLSPKFSPSYAADDVVRFSLDLSVDYMQVSGLLSEVGKAIIKGVTGVVGGTLSKVRGAIGK
jgi:hypothetical protein